jgi:tRNA nucleotidyltransferase/poly(A) polymerase
MEKNRMLHNAGLLQEVELKFKIELPPNITILHNAFKAAGKKLYAVGGCVRDAVIGIKPKDFDVATDAKPDEVMVLLSIAGIKSIPKGESFGVVSAIMGPDENREEFEIATFREESYEGGDGRRPTKVWYSDILGDSKRRDLTINALYYDIDEQKIIDLVGGLEDIKNKRIRAVGNVMDRFTEDKLRVLRFLRFAHRFGTPLDEETKRAILHYKDLPGVSNERVRDEFLKGLKSAIKPEKYLEDYKDFGLLPRVFQGVAFDTEFITGLSDPMLVIAKILSPNPIKKVLKSLEILTAKNEEKDSVKFLFSLIDKFKDFHKLSFVPEVDGKWLMSLQSNWFIQKKYLTNDQIIKWAEIMHLNVPAVKKLIDSKLPFSAANFPELPEGKELGIAIAKANGEHFIKGL